MRLAGINDLASANAFLPGDLETHNRRFAVAPTDQDDAHLPDEGEAIGLARFITGGSCRRTWCGRFVRSATSCKRALPRAMPCVEAK